MTESHLYAKKKTTRVIMHEEIWGGRGQATAIVLSATLRSSTPQQQWIFWPKLPYFCHSREIWEKLILSGFSRWFLTRLARLVQEHDLFYRFNVLCNQLNLFLPKFISFAHRNFSSQRSLFLPGFTWAFGVKLFFTPSMKVSVWTGTSRVWVR